MAVRKKGNGYNDTIISESAVGKRLSGIRSPGTTYIVFQGKRVPFVSNLTIGRDPSNSVNLDDKLVSRKHAMIKKIKGVFFIRDLGSTNGTFVNGKQIPPEKYVCLQSNDKITIGRTELSMLHFK